MTSRASQVQYPLCRPPAGGVGRGREAAKAALHGAAQTGLKIWIGPADYRDPRPQARLEPTPGPSLSIPGLRAAGRRLQARTGREPARRKQGGPGPSWDDRDRRLQARLESTSGPSLSISGQRAAGRRLQARTGREPAQRGPGGPGPSWDRSRIRSRPPQKGTQRSQTLQTLKEASHRVSGY
jgi:hypothetical protein